MLYIDLFCRIIIGAHYILIIQHLFSLSVLCLSLFPLSRDIFLYEGNASEYGGNVLPR